MGANIIEVAHNRLALDVPAKGAEFDIMIETRDAQHTQEIMDALRDARLSAARRLRSHRMRRRSLTVLALAALAAGRLRQASGRGRPGRPRRSRPPRPRPSWPRTPRSRGVKALPSGVQYKIVRSGPAGGLKPEPDRRGEGPLRGQAGQRARCSTRSYERGRPGGHAAARPDPGAGWRPCSRCARATSGPSMSRRRRATAKGRRRRDPAQQRADLPHRADRRTAGAGKTSLGE